jgi:LacI family transcriptional regulator
MPTIRDVARQANVSISTVSHVINDTRFVAPATRERVLEAIRDLNYKHNRIASSLRNQKTQTFGVLLPNSANPYFAEVLAGIEDAAYAHNYNIILGNAHDDPEREISYVQVLLSRQVDGILLISTGAHQQSLELTAESNTPVVLVDRSAHVDGVDEIFTDNLGGGRVATEAVLALGHRRIGCVTGPSFLTPSAERVEGYRQALANFDAPDVVQEDALIVAGDFQHHGGYEAGKQLLALDERPTAIFACNDLMAVGVMSAAHEAGLRVPEDLSVIGYDNIPLAGYSSPRLTTVGQPAKALGSLAVERLFARISNPDSATQHERLDVVLVERDSCAPPAKV